MVGLSTLCSQSSSVRGSTASSTTIFHRCLSSNVIIVSSSIVSPVQSLILPNQFVFGLPLARSVVPWIISFSRHLSFFLVKLYVQSISFFALNVFTYLSWCLSVSTHWSTNVSQIGYSPSAHLQYICSFFCPWNPQYKSQAFHLKGIYSCLICFLRVQLSHSYVATGRTKAFNNFTFVVIFIPWFSIVFTTPNTACGLQCCHNLCFICVSLHPIFLHALSSLTASVGSSIANFRISEQCRRRISDSAPLESAVI